MRVFIALGSLLVLALLAALIAPHFIDWTAYRADFEREASRILGQPVVVRGEASAQLLPFPSLTFTDVSVGGGDVPLMTLARFGLDAELAPYLSGEIRIFQMRLDDPHLRVSIDKDGFAGWLGGVGGRATVVLEKVEVTGGSITVENRSAGETYELSDIGGTFSAAALSGPYKGAGQLTAAGRPFRFDVSSGSVADLSALPLRLALQSDTLDASLAVEGTAQLGEGEPVFNGTLRVDRPLPSVAAGVAAEKERLEAPAAPSASLPPVRVTGALAMSLVDAKLSDLRAEVGELDAPYVLNGSGKLAYGANKSFELTLEGEQVDVDTIAAGVLPKRSGPVAFSDRIEAARRTLAALPKPPIRGRIDLTLPVVTAGDTTIRTVRIVGTPVPDGWQLDKLSAELPGRTLLEASGTASVAETLGFRGALLVASRQPPGFAEWLTGKADPALNTVERAGFSAKVDLSAEAQLLDDLEVSVGKQTLKGRLQRSGRAGARLVAANLSGGAVDLDAFGAFLKLFVSDTDAFEAPERVDVGFDAGPVTFGDVGARGIDTDFSFNAGTLDLRRFLARDFAGADVELEGTVSGLPLDPKPDVSVSIASDAPQRFLDFLRARFPDDAILRRLGQAGERLGPLSLAGTATSVTADGAPALKIRMDGKAGGTGVTFAFALENGFAAARTKGRFGLDLTLANEHPTVLLGQLGLAVGVPVEPPSPLTIEVSLSGSAGETVMTTAAARAADTRLDASGMIDLGDDGISKADLKLKAESADLAPWMLAGGIATGTPLDPVPADLSAEFHWTPRDWTLGAVSGSLAGRTVTASFRSSGSGTPLKGSLGVSELSLPWLATLVYGVSPPSEAIASADAVFGASLLPKLPLEVSVTADRLRIDPDTAATAFTGRAAVTLGSLILSDASLQVAGGSLGGSLELRNASGFGSLKLDGTFTGLELPHPASGGARLDGRLSGGITLEAGAQNYVGLASALSGTGRVTLSDGHLNGFAPGSFPRILADADVDGFKPDLQPVAALLDRLNASASIPLASLSTDLTIGAGVLRFAPVSFGAADERVTAEGSIDLARLTADATVRQAFQPAEEDRSPDAEPTVTYRLVGPLDRTVLSAGVEPLASFLGFRSRQRKEARVRGVRDDLRETLRLRREVRVYAARQAERERRVNDWAAAEAAERERLDRERSRLQGQRQSEAAEPGADRARREAESLPQSPAPRSPAEPAPRPATPRAGAGTPVARPVARQTPAAAPDRPLDFGQPVGVGRTEPTRPFEGLPGVNDPISIR